MWLCGLPWGASCFKVFPCSLSLCFVIHFSIVITSLWEEGVCLCASRAFVFLFCTCSFLSLFSSSWCRGLAVVCDCDTPWTFLLCFCSPYFKQSSKMTRHSHTFALRQINTSVNFYKYSFFTMAVVQWNKLPADVVMMHTLPQFSVAVG